MFENSFCFKKVLNKEVAFSSLEILIVFITQRLLLFVNHGLK